MIEQPYSLAEYSILQRFTWNTWVTLKYVTLRRVALRVYTFIHELISFPASYANTLPHFDI